MREINNQEIKPDNQETADQKKARLHQMGLELADLYGKLREYQDRRKKLKKGTGAADECDYWIGIFKLRIADTEGDMEYLSKQIAESSEFEKPE